MNHLKKRIYKFAQGTVEGSGSMTQLLGGKGAGLAEMTLLSIPVPPGFTITTEVCRHYLERAELPAELEPELRHSLHWLERETLKRFGDARNPLLVSVRSGAPVSMPGMMDTVLNLGLNDETVKGLAHSSGSLTFALDSYRRLLQMFGSVVLGVSKHAFEEAALEVRNSIVPDGEDSFEYELSLTIAAFQTLILEQTGSPFPQDATVQISMAIEAVFRSWRSDRAVFYRKLNAISDAMGTAITVQAMVFGNRGMSSGTGVGFTRNPSTGAAQVFGEYLPNAQGEDIVAGTRTPLSIAELADTMPAVYLELLELTEQLERHYEDAQDFEFTVEDGKLFLLQTRAAKRSGLAAVKIAVDMANEGLISRAQALERVTPNGVVEMLSPQLDLAKVAETALTVGLAASPGAAVGMLALSAEAAVIMHAAGQAVILVTQETTADDIHGMDASVGFLTARGGATSHAAVVARGMGKCCITGAREITIMSDGGSARIGNRTFKQGDWLSLDGSTGRVFAGKLPVRPASENHPELDQLLEWAASVDSCKVHANADTAADVLVSVANGAAGIGLCRTEHMFFAAGRLAHVRAMILAATTAERVAALELLLPMQQADFENLLRTMAPRPVTIRLLDPPLHEFLPASRELEMELAEARGKEDWERCSVLQATLAQVEALSESNPMMGHRGCRLSLTYPEILRMQVRAILQAALVVQREGLAVRPEIMVPLVSSEQEMRVLADLIHATAQDVFAAHKASVQYCIGTMIELPRAAVCADSIAKHVSFISFGTNDLTQMTYGFSRDDARSYLDSYLEQGIFKVDPFITIDRDGVGQLMEMAIRKARHTNPSIKIGVCGEHGGDPESITFFHSLGVDYVSCSPSRLRVAQLAVAQAGLLARQTEETAELAFAN